MLTSKNCFKVTGLGTSPVEVMDFALDYENTDLATIARLQIAKLTALRTIAADQKAYLDENPTSARVDIEFTNTVTGNQGFAASIKYSNTSLYTAVVLQLAMLDELISVSQEQLYGLKDAAKSPAAVAA